MEAAAEKELPISTIPEISLDEIVIRGKTKKRLTMEVHNNDKNKKLVEFGAKIDLISSHKIVNEKLSAGLSRGENLIWLKEKRELIELRPGYSSNIIIVSLDDNEISTGNLKLGNKNEIILQLVLTFSGKYEGENEFRNHIERRAVYNSPKIERLAFTNVAVTYPNIHPKLLEVMHVMNNGTFYDDDF